MLPSRVLRLVGEQVESVIYLGTGVSRSLYADDFQTPVPSLILTGELWMALQSAPLLCRYFKTLVSDHTHPLPPPTA